MARVSKDIDFGGGTPDRGEPTVDAPDCWPVRIHRERISKPETPWPARVVRIRIPEVERVAAVAPVQPSRGLLTRFDRLTF